MARRPTERGTGRGATGFAASASSFAEKVIRRQTAVYRFSVQDLVRMVLLPVAKGGNMPVKTGNLRRSARASKRGVPGMTGGREFADGSAEIASTIATLNLGERFFLGFQAVYARRMEAKYGFVRLAQQKWRSIVNRNILRVKSAVARRSA
jgi:hypothetical protein